MPQLVHLKDGQFQRYIVAGDNWDGKVYHQENIARSNAVWAVVEGDPAVTFYRLIDLKHGMHLLNAYGQSGYGFDDVANTAIVESPIDNRARWTRSATSPYTLKDGLQQKVLYSNGTNYGIRLGGDPASPNAKWEFVNATSGYFTVPRLPLTLDGNRAATIGWEVDLGTRPQYGHVGANVTDADLLGVLFDAVNKWITAFNQMGLKQLSLFPSKPPGVAAPGVAAPKYQGAMHIKFQWGQVTDQHSGAQVSSSDARGWWSDRSIVPTVITFNSASLWAVTDRDGFKLDLRSAAAHELGHLFGLDHDTRPGSLMQPKLDTGDIWTRQGDSICGSDMLRLRARYVDVFFPS